MEEFESIEKEAEYMVTRIPINTMLCNLFWGWWAIIVSKNPSIDFDYL